MSIGNSNDLSTFSLPVWPSVSPCRPHAVPALGSARLPWTAPLAHAPLWHPVAGAARRGRRQTARGESGNTMQTAMQKLVQRWRRGAGVEAWSLSLAAVGDGSVTHETQSGRGP